MTTTIAVSEGIRDKLKRHGIKGETYNQILARIMNTIESDQYLSEVYIRLEEKDRFIPLEEIT